MRLFKGLLAATFIPMKPDGTLNVALVPRIVDHLVTSGVEGLYVCGSTGEGPLLSSDERMKTAQAYVDAGAGRIPVIVQVGHNSLAEAGRLAHHAKEIGADAISAICPNYFKCDSVGTMIDCFVEMTADAGDLPFFYYHIPALTGVQVDMIDFIDEAAGRLANFRGIKYSALTVHEFQQCLEYADGKYEILFGCDEMLLSAYAVGAYGAVGSTYNFAAPLYRMVIESFEKGDMETARRYQSYSIRLCRLLYKYRGQPAFKAMMKILGMDCGPNRLPQKTLTSEEVAALKGELEELGYFEWMRAAQKALEKKGRVIGEAAVGKKRNVE